MLYDELVLHHAQGGGVVATWKRGERTGCVFAASEELVLAALREHAENDPAEWPEITIEEG